MFWSKKPKSQLDLAIVDALNDLMNHPVATPGYDARLDKVERLYKLKESETPKPEALSPNTMANIGANLLGIFMIIRHEHVNVIASKALGFVTKTKIV
jgi:hypothetical protein